MFEVALLQKLLQFILQIPQSPHLGRILRFMCNVSQINPEEVPGHIDHLAELEGNIALGPKLDLAAISQWSEGILLGALAFEPVVIILAHLLLQDQHQSVGNCRQHVLGTMRTDSD